MNLPVNAVSFCCILIYILMQNVLSVHRFKLLCPPGWLENGFVNKCMKFFENKEPFAKARAACNSKGGKLVISENCFQTVFLSDQLESRNSTYWIGLKRNRLSPDFVWVDAPVARLAHRNWHRFNPNLTGNMAVCAVINSPGIAKGFWVDDLCSKKHAFVCQKDPVKICHRGHFGPQCKHRCSPRCDGSGDCDITNGTCLSGCLPGFKGALCNEPCDNGTYGQNCASSCSLHCAGHGNGCRHQDGKCTLGCRSGYKGGRCDRPCRPRTYGQGCVQNCSANCAGRFKHCNNSDGKCTMGCTKGFTGPFCDLAAEKPYDFSIFIVAAECAFSTLACLIISALVLSNKKAKGQKSSADSAREFSGLRELSHQEPHDFDESHQEPHELGDPQHEHEPQT
ncbi:hypothetical protein RRG08_007883 [Elysia crispata]|uniref:C-type lectin domain-containing protein n=1 Tax=Elysia crispata TaxID=231223 RepID=A0AAE0XXP7_9GAST|nr:hypothetical protein RRG08_007883 [Elysia crispata]